MIPESKICKECTRDLPADQFGRSRSGSGRQYLVSLKRDGAA